eukprot:g5258.t1
MASAEFESLFERASASGRITSARQWESLVQDGLDRGLFTVSELPLLERIWKEAEKSIGAFTSRAQRDLTIRSKDVGLSLKTFQAKLIQNLLAENQLASDLKNCVARLPVAVHQYCRHRRAQPVPLGREHVLFAVEKVESLQSSVRAAAEELHKTSTVYTKQMEAAYLDTLFWNELAPQAGEKYCKDAHAFQEKYLTKIENMIVRLSNDIPHSLIAKKRNSNVGKDKNNATDSPFGHACGGNGQFGIRQYVWHPVVPHKNFDDEWKENEKKESQFDFQRIGSVEVVDMPLFGVPASVRNAIECTFSGHRQLVLSRFAPNCLGDDCVSVSGHRLFFYQSYNAISLEEVLLRLDKGLTRRNDISSPLNESDPLFRFWAAEISSALTDLETQSTFDLLAPLSLKNFAVSHSGTRLHLARIPFGESLSGKNLRNRNRKLAADFGSILRDLLGFSSRSKPRECAVSNDALSQGLLLRRGDFFRLDLELPPLEEIKRLGAGMTGLVDGYGVGEWVWSLSVQWDGQKEMEQIDKKTAKRMCPLQPAMASWPVEGVSPLFEAIGIGSVTIEVSLIARWRSERLTRAREERKALVAAERAEFMSDWVDRGAEEDQLDGAQEDAALASASTESNQGVDPCRWRMQAVATIEKIPVSNSLGGILRACDVAERNASSMDDAEWNVGKEKVPTARDLNRHPYFFQVGFHRCSLDQLDEIGLKFEQRLS